MSKIVSILAFAFIIFTASGCIKDSAPPPCTPATVESEKPTMIGYAASIGMGYSEDPSGLFYSVVTAGSGPTPTVNSKIYVTYVGKLTSNGAVIDSQTTPELTGWVLRTLIPAWQYGIPHINEGGTIKLIVPSSLAYGCRGFGSVPPNSVLYFEITLVDVQ